MSKGLLLGNGINAHLGIKGLSKERIARRFYQNLQEYSNLFNDIFGLEISEDDLKNHNQKEYDEGIESLAEILYHCIKFNNVKRRMDVNDEIILYEFIKGFCLTSIFYDENGEIIDSNTSTQMFDVKKYDYVFTLNYAEFWDKDNKCNFLHGRLPFSELPKEKTLLINWDRIGIINCKGVGSAKIDGSIFDGIVFAPQCVKKENQTNVTGLFPSENLFPADDLFPYEGIELYKELDIVDELDIFGMSPYGDESIIEKINEKRFVRVYIYHKKKNDETEVWDNKIKCKKKLLDSTKIKEQTILSRCSRRLLFNIS